MVRLDQQALRRVDLLQVQLADLLQVLMDQLVALAVVGIAAPHEVLFWADQFEAAREVRLRLGGEKASLGRLYPRDDKSACVVIC